VSKCIGEKDLQGVVMTLADGGIDGDMVVGFFSSQGAKGLTLKGRERGPSDEYTAAEKTHGGKGVICITRPQVWWNEKGRRRKKRENLSSC